MEATGVAFAGAEGFSIPLFQRTTAHAIALVSRSVLIDGEPWFVAADACRILGIVNPTHAVRPLVNDEKTVTTAAASPSLFQGLDRRVKSVIIISRPGLFKLIQRSNKPEAKEFDRWVRHEVLPQVMDNGGYMLPLSPSQPPLSHL